MLWAAVLVFCSAETALAQLSSSLEHEALPTARSGERIHITTEFATESSVDSVRVYFRAAGDVPYAFVPMQVDGSKYAGVLPALARGAETLEYLILVRSPSGGIETSQTFRVEVQDGVESDSSAQPLTVYTELPLAPPSLPGFADNVLIETIEPQVRYGRLAGIIDETTEESSGTSAPTSTPSPTTTSPTTAGSRTGIGTLGMVGIGALVVGLGTASGDRGTSNRPPSFTGTGTLSRSVAEGTSGAIGSPLTATDPDGNRLIYSLVGADAAAFEIDSQTAQLSVRDSTTLNFEEQATYTFEVQASDGNLTASRAVQVSVTDVDEPPGRVGAPTISPVSESRLDVSWTRPANAGPEITGYGIRYRIDGRGEWQSLSLTGAGRSVELTGLSIRTRYEVQVRAINDEGVGEWSSSGRASTDEPPWWDDWLALRAFHREAHGYAWERNDNWSSSFNAPTAEELDSWYGVTVSDGRVTRLELDRNSLEGPIPTTLTRLTALQVLSLPRNELTGPIPPELGTMSSLRVLALHENALTGPIPVELTSLPNLAVLILSGNALTGSIPPELANLPALVSLNLQYNALSGTIPAELGALTRLETLALSQNALTGPIPPELGKLSRLVDLQLDTNELAGPVPPELGNLFSLETLYLERNKLSGPLPGSLVNLAALNDFQWGDQNTAEGKSALCAPTEPVFQTWLAGVSARFGPNCGLVSGKLADDWRALVALYKATNGADWRNNFNWSASESPPTAAEFDNWYGVTVSDNRVTHLHLGSNSLSGSIPPELGSLSELVALSLRDNTLTGPIPAELGNLSRLQGLFLFDNQLTGSLPGSLGNLSALDALWLQRNKLTGPIPAELGNLTNLVQLDLGSNSLTGPIPAELGRLSRLQTLWLNNNELSGSIPAELANMTELRSLELRHNALSGSVPPELHKLTKLTGLAINGNKLTGSLPDDLRRLWDLRIEWGEQTPATGDLALCAPTDPTFQEWLRLVTSGSPGPNCPKSGTLTADWRALVALYTDLNGATWDRNDGWSSYDSMPTADELDAWYGVTVRGGRVVGLDLRNNGLQGRAPLELGYLDGLTNLDVSSNFLTGPLPPGLPTAAGLVFVHWGNQSVAPGENVLCAPMDEAFQRWLEHVPDQAGPVCESLADSLREDWEALVELYESTDGANWRNNENWSNSDQMPTAEELDTWYGVTVRDGRVTGLELRLNGLAGPLPATVANLTSLTALNLRNNDLTGSIPTALGDLVYLESLFLDANRLTGSIPPQLGALSRVAYLFLGKNELTGPLPPELGNLRTVHQFNLSENDLTGSIPAEWGGLSNLFLLDLSRNSLTGPIPPELGKLSRLYFLNLNNNSLTGSVPPEFGQMSSLGALGMLFNSLTGPLPDTLTALDRLDSMHWGHQSVMPGEQALCAPTDTVFQDWLSRLDHRTGPNCEDTTAPPSSRSAPRVQGVHLTSSPGVDGTYGAGEAVEVAVRFSEAVSVTGAPRLNLGIGARMAPAVHVQAGASTVQSFRYVVSHGDHDLDGISIGSMALVLNGAAIRSAEGTAAATDLGVHAIENSSEHIVDARALSAERTVLTDALAAQGRALLASTSGVIGERFRAERSGRGTGLIGDVADTLRGLDALDDAPLQSTERGAASAAPGCHRSPSFGAGTTCPNGPWTAIGHSLAPAAGRSTAAPPWGRGFTLPLGDTGSSGRGRWTMWGAQDMQSFNGESANGGFDGDLRSFYLGLDGQLSGEWLAGAAVSKSRGEATYHFKAGEVSGAGTLHTDLTSVYPYIHRNGSNGWSMWSIGGVGAGEASVLRGGAGATESSGLWMGLAAGGVQQELMTLEFMDVSLIADAGFVRLQTGGESIVLGGLSASVGRMRVGVKGEHTLHLGASHELSPYWQLSARYDAGDGHTGGGVEMAGGVRYASARIEVHVQGRWLAVRSDAQYEEFGAGASLEFRPRSDGMGFTASLQQNWGMPGRGTQSMWREQALRTVYAAQADRPAVNPWSTDARVGYALALPGTAGRLTPFGEFRLAGESSVRGRAGVRLDRGGHQRSQMGLEVGLGLSDRSLVGGAAGTIDVSIEARF